MPCGAGEGSPQATILSRERRVYLSLSGLCVSQVLSPPSPAVPPWSLSLRLSQSQARTGGGLQALRGALGEGDTSYPVG